MNPKCRHFLSSAWLQDVLKKKSMTQVTFKSMIKVYLQKILFCIKVLYLLSIFNKCSCIVQCIMPHFRKYVDTFQKRLFAMYVKQNQSHKIFYKNVGNHVSLTHILTHTPTYKWARTCLILFTYGNNIILSKLELPDGKFLNDVGLCAFSLCLSLNLT
jgi:hypothetical protein